MLILGSSSPRRADLLRQIGLNFDVIAADIDESVYPEESAGAYVERMSNSKFSEITKRKDWDHTFTILTADTVVVLEGEILGKPKNASHGEEMLARMSGQAHRVLTSVTIGRNSHDFHQFITETIVHFRTLTKQDISAYWATQEPQDKAGGYAIQGIGAIFVESIEGSYSNVVGLPLKEAAQVLSTYGVPVLPNIPNESHFAGPSTE